MKNMLLMLCFITTSFYPMHPDFSRLTYQDAYELVRNSNQERWDYGFTRWSVGLFGTFFTVWGLWAGDYTAPAFTGTLVCLALIPGLKNCCYGERHRANTIKEILNKIRFVQNVENI